MRKYKINITQVLNLFAGKSVVEREKERKKKRKNRKYKQKNPLKKSLIFNQINKNTEKSRRKSGKKNWIKTCDGKNSLIKNRFKRFLTHANIRLEN